MRRLLHCSKSLMRKPDMRPPAGPPPPAGAHAPHPSAPPLPLGDHSLASRAWQAQSTMTDLITLTEARAADLPAFKKNLQDAFALAVIEEFGPLPDGPIPSDEDLDGAFAAPGAVVLHILRDGHKVGGAVVTINDTTKHNSLDLFFISPGNHGRGLGHRAWTAIEQRYPDTRVWHTHTPYFEKRNIHFYVNKCGFKITAFFNAHHADPHRPSTEDFPGADEAFQFEKIMPGTAAAT